jgi:CRISPR-associated exonuclease Cas4
MEKVTGTLVWYYSICQRECWLMAHELNPYQENTLMELGRLVHEESYSREKKEFETAGLKIDILGKKDGRLLVGEIKKSDRFLESATMQLSFYLYRLKEMGIDAKGELLIPKSRKRIPVELSEQVRKKIIRTTSDIMNIIGQSFPPPAEKCRFCRNCAYREYCFA